MRLRMPSAGCDYMDIEEIKQLNARNGQFFFTPETMRFFKSKVNDGVITGTWKGIKVAFFITSEKFSDETPRKYTIRACVLEDAPTEAGREDYGYKRGHIESVSEFQAFATLRTARARMEIIAAPLYQYLSVVKSMLKEGRTKDDILAMLQANFNLLPDYQFNDLIEEAME
mgnify:CR=1 FL=1